MISKAVSKLVSAAAVSGRQELNLKLKLTANKSRSKTRNVTAEPMSPFVDSFAARPIESGRQPRAASHGRRESFDALDQTHRAQLPGT